MDDYDTRFRELYSRAYGVAYVVLGDRGDAEDVAQETLARAHMRWRRVAAYAGPWVVRVAGNLAIDRVRRRGRSMVVVPEATDAADDRRVDLQRALLALPRRQREVVVLRYLADLSEADTARSLDISVGSVKTHASRGLAALRVTLAEVDV